MLERRITLRHSGGDLHSVAVEPASLGSPISQDFTSFASAANHAVAMAQRLRLTIHDETGRLTADVWLALIAASEAE